MATFLFDSIIFGPVTSRRLGVSLGINLLPTDAKICSFDCLYCECGWTPIHQRPKAVMPSRGEVQYKLEFKLTKMVQAGQLPDVITFAGNGEPTLHPDFAGIIDDTVVLRNALAPNARIAVLSNATRLHKSDVFAALLKVDDNIQKLDSGIESTIQLLDRPIGKLNLPELVEQLASFNGKVTIQTMFLRGRFQNHTIDNTSPEELEAWLKLLTKIGPSQVMIYTLARDTAFADLSKVSKEELNAIAAKVRSLGYSVQVSA